MLNSRPKQKDNIITNMQTMVINVGEVQQKHSDSGKYRLIFRGVYRQNDGVYKFADFYFDAVKIFEIFKMRNIFGHFKNFNYGDLN